jgi:hypothetical protein
VSEGIPKRAGMGEPLPSVLGLATVAGSPPGFV